METQITEDEYIQKIINIENLLKNYLLENYDINNSDISLKFTHTFQTKKANDTITNFLNLTPREKYLSSVIALFHDYGRFEQIKKFSSFNDFVSLDHADVAVEMLFNNNELNNFVTDLDEEEKEIVKNAIKYHNKLNVDPSLSEKQKLFCNIIRDADKIDIYRILSEDSRCQGLKVGKLIQEDLDNFYNNQLYKQKKEIDFYSDVLLHISYIFDLNFDISYKILVENCYVKKYIYTVLLFANFKVDKRLMECFEYIEKYLKEKASK